MKNVYDFFIFGGGAQKCGGLRFKWIHPSRPRQLHLPPIPPTLSQQCRWHHNPTTWEPTESNMARHFRYEVMVGVRIFGMTTPIHNIEHVMSLIWL